MEEVGGSFLGLLDGWKIYNKVVQLTNQVRDQSPFFALELFIQPRPVWLDTLWPATASRTADSLVNLPRCIPVHVPVYHRALSKNRLPHTLSPLSLSVSVGAASTQKQKPIGLVLLSRHRRDTFHQELPSTLPSAHQGHVQTSHAVEVSPPLAPGRCAAPGLHNLGSEGAPDRTDARQRRSTVQRSSTRFACI